ncbi:MarR family transcriptional regulator [Mycobacterium arosiense]|uniref:MarR family transcriptional regulator n=1 Tax=Mycobacterium arosiense ATCC BAA-1401 = DSM 45069 TaxID=1265311 RepID=A0A1W9ZQL7_MYCAI|nr:MarR family transcriptional regulator [Mycobacterium arosiense]ORA19915.1 MarR family transcriptional regulator [Mycobacterium arosiense ATCC BAA-1401 = DSM 45069]
MSELTVLQGVRLKGRVGLDELADTIGEEPTVVAGHVDALGGAGLLAVGKSLRITPAGRGRLEQLLAAERQGIDEAAIHAAYNEFRGVNAEFKELVSDWQLRDGAPNTHEDAAYDTAVLARLEPIHERTTAIIAAAAKQIPRLAYYADKLGNALLKVHSGDTAWLTRPVIDSYHTVWFELHEELIVAAGLTRADEAAAGNG